MRVSLRICRTFRACLDRREGSGEIDPVGCSDYRCRKRSPWEDTLRKLPIGLSAMVIAACSYSPALAQNTVKVGVVLTSSGQFADAGAQLDNGIKTYMKQFGDTVAGKKIEIIRKDTGGAAPDVAKRLAQELVVRDNVDILAGWVLTPNALAAADVSAQAKKFMVVMNAATSIVITKSPYMIRTLGRRCRRSWTRSGAGRPRPASSSAYTMVTDYGPGHDFEAALHHARSRKRAARSSARCASRWPTRTSRRSSSAPRTSTRNASSSSCRAARNRRRSARRSRSAASIPTRRRFWARAKRPPSRRSPAWVTPASASSRRGTTTTRARRRAM